jgi:flagellar biosynthesis/type III secretory pathway protein FliH
MATVLKSKQLQLGENTASVEVFNWEDVATKARAYLATVKQQAQEILDQANQQSQELRQQAERDGIAAGQGDITTRAEKLANQLATERVKQATVQLHGLAEELEQASHQWLRQWQHEMVPLAIAMAERLVHRQIELDPSIMLDWLQESVRMIQSQQKVELRVHPQDAEILGASLTDFIEQQKHRVSIELVLDEAIARRGLKLRTAEMNIDQQIQSQLDRLEQELQ